MTDLATNFITSAIDQLPPDALAEIQAHILQKEQRNTLPDPHNRQQRAQLRPEHASIAAAKRMVMQSLKVTHVNSPSSKQLLQ